MQLEKFYINDCPQLEYIITIEGLEEEKMDYDDSSQNSLGPMFPKLKFLNVRRCEKLEFVLPICFVEDHPLLERVKIIDCEELKYIYGQYPNEGDLHQKQEEIRLSSLQEMKVFGVPKFTSIYPESHHPMSCILQKSSPIITKDVSKVKDPSPSYNFPWVCKCCRTLPKSSATTIANLSDNIGSQSQVLLSLISLVSLLKYD